MSDNKDESNSTTSDVKKEESYEKNEETKTLDESSKDDEKESVKEDSVKEETVKEENEKTKNNDDDDGDNDEEEEVGLLDRPVEVTGCRARKKVERLEISFATPKEKTGTIPEGKGKKLGEIPRIELQITKTSVNDLKTLHRVLFGRVGGATEIKKNLRKFSGFTFENDSPEYEKKKAQFEKITMAELKHFCSVLDLERSGVKEEILNRLLDFLLDPKDSGKKVPKKKTGSKEKKSSAKKAKNAKSKSTKETMSDDQDSENEKSSDKEDQKNDTSDADAGSDSEPKKKTKSAKKMPAKTLAKKSEKKEKPKKEEKKAVKISKRKRDDTDESSDDEPVSKKSKVPSDDEIRKLITKILDDADLEEITMKKVIKQVADNYPDCDLSHKKAFIKSTIKTVIS